ncbi:MAG: DUF4157 domain-containing protein [Deltaproteobacteria bacterium]|nr:DUF4157 domain-containing protein [Deltaproteobacteria bacterium]
MTKTHELEHDRDHHDVHRSSDPTLAPGRGTRAQDLVGPTGRLPSGILMRKARDANGVQAGAEHAVARASSSSGHALPDDVRGKFESSLGADLSSVRVHTGAESVASANAVGAKAYTIGSDIHFGAGHYDPTTNAGQHLLAHEVAHTVQQAGGAIGAQYKLEVSSAGDAFEAEADRAADAMTRGQAFSVGGAGAALSRSPARIARAPITLPEQRIDGEAPNVITLPEQQIGGGEAEPQQTGGGNAITLPEQQIDGAAPNAITLPEQQIDGAAPNVITLPEQQIEGDPVLPANTDQMAKNADGAEAAARGRTGGSSVIGDAGAVTVANKQEADKVVQLIGQDQTKLEAGIATGDIDASVRKKNADTVNQLSAYSDVLGDDKFNTDLFQQQSQALGADFARLHAQMMTLDKSGQGSGAVSRVAQNMDPGASRGKRLGETVIDAGSGQSAAELNKDFKQTMTAPDGAQGHSTNATAHRNDAEKCKKDMNDAASAVATKSRELMPKQKAAEGAAASIKAAAAAADVGKLQGEIDALRAKAAEAEEKVKLVGGVIKDAVAIGASATSGKIDAAVGTAINLVTSLTAYAAKHWNDGDIAEEAEKKKVAAANLAFSNTRAAAMNAQAVLGDLRASCVGFQDGLKNLADAKTNYRDAMQLMGNSLDKAQGGNAYSIVAQVLAEAEAYLTQSQLTITSGRNAIGKLPAKDGGPRRDAGTTGTLTYYLAVAPADKHTFFATRATVTLKGSLAGGADLLSDDLAKVIERMEQERAEIEGLANSLRAVFKV